MTRDKYLLNEARRLVFDLFKALEDGDLNTDKFFALRERVRLLQGDIKLKGVKP